MSLAKYIILLFFSESLSLVGNDMFFLYQYI